MSTHLPPHRHHHAAESKSVPRPRSYPPSILPPSEAGSLPRPGLYLWATGGVVLLLSQALWRLAPIAWEPIARGLLSPSQWAVLVAWTLANLYLEGYRGFQKKFVPRVLARAHYLTTHTTPFRVALAPLYAMAFFHARRRALISAWALTTLIVCAIVFVRTLPQPWRGIIDAGVVSGLAYGTAALVLGIVRRLLGAIPPGNPEVEERDAQARQADESSQAHLQAS